jgi:hypothetical protein
MLRFVLVPILIIVGTSVAVRPSGYVRAMARWMRRVAPSNHVLPASGDPSSYAALARAGGVFFVFGGVMALLNGH